MSPKSTTTTDRDRSDLALTREVSAGIFAVSVHDEDDDDGVVAEEVKNMQLVFE